MQVHELALQRNKYKHLTDDEWRWLLQQVEGRERTADKLPSFAAIEDWWYPVRLSCEQCSSEMTARYKASLIAGGQKRMADLTGGYGVDTFFLSELFEHTDYVEQNAELCRIAEHNKGEWQKVKGECSIHVHNTSAEDFLASAGTCDLLFIDPARRDSYGGKVFRLEDCTPNVVELLPTLLTHLTPEGSLMLKLSPMLDITQAVKELSASNIQWSVYVVAVKNEVKEVLLLGERQKDERANMITAIDLAEPEQAFVFSREEERECLLINGDASLNGAYLYEPNAAILKAGAYKLVVQRFGLQKLDVNTHLYASNTLVENFPGRVWQLMDERTKGRKDECMQANVLTRNYPLTPEQLKKKMRLKDGGDYYLIGARKNGKPTLFWAQRVEKS